jgi:chromosomal replication initiator protein
MGMLKKKEIWDQIIGALETRLSKGELKTWFSRASLKRLDPDVAVIDVPNKFIANWLSDRYLTDLKKSFKRVTKTSPSIHFSFERSKPGEDIQNFPAKFSSETDLKRRLNPSMTFGAFLADDCNRFAFSSSRAVADHTDDQYSLLYIHSGPGLGKTHLLHAIGNQKLEKDPSCRLRYVSSDAFSSDFTYSINNDKIGDFRREYSDLDLLLFDDIHTLGHREKTQEEFLFVFNSLYGAKKQLVITGDSAPNKTKNISPELKSRLGWGLITDIQPPGQDIKMELIRKRALETQMDIPDDVVFFLANSSHDFKTAVRNLIKIETHASFTEGKITISRVKTLLREKERAKIGLDDIMTATAGYFDISLSDLVSDKKKRQYAYPRQLAMYLARSHTELSFKEIGNSFGKKDHTTVIHAFKRIGKMKAEEKEIGEDLKRIEDLLD